MVDDMSDDAESITTANVSDQMPDAKAGATDSSSIIRKRALGAPSTSTSQPTGHARNKAGKRKSLEIEERTDESMLPSTAKVSSKRRKRGFDDKVLKAQTLRVGHKILLLGTLDEWREVLDLTKRRFRQELIKKGDVGLGEDGTQSAVGSDSSDSQGQDLDLEFAKADADAEKAVLALCGIFGATGIRRAWDYLELIRTSKEIADIRSADDDISEAVVPTNAHRTPLDQFIAAEERTYTSQTKAWSAQIMQLLQSVEFIRAYHRLIDDASRDGSQTSRELQEAGLYTGRGRGWTSVALSLLLKKKYGFGVENGHLKDENSNPEIMKRRKGLANKIQDGTRVFTYTEYLGTGAVIFAADTTKEKQL